MFLHMLMQSVDIFEETYMTKLVQLVVSDGLYLHIVAEVLQVCPGSCHCCDSGAGKLTLEVEVNLYTRSGFPAFTHSPRISCRKS